MLRFWTELPSRTALSACYQPVNQGRASGRVVRLTLPWQITSSPCAKEFAICSSSTISLVGICEILFKTGFSVVIKLHSTENRNIEMTIRTLTIVYFSVLCFVKLQAIDFEARYFCPRWLENIEQQKNHFWAPSTTPRAVSTFLFLFSSFAHRSPAFNPALINAPQVSSMTSWNVQRWFYLWSCQN